MVNMVIAYVLIAVLLTTYGASIYMRTRRAAAELRALEAGETQP